MPPARPASPRRPNAARTAQRQQPRPDPPTALSEAPPGPCQHGFHSAAVCAYLKAVHICCPLGTVKPMTKPSTSLNRPPSGQQITRHPGPIPPRPALPPPGPLDATPPHGSLDAAITARLDAGTRLFYALHHNPEITKLVTSPAWTRGLDRAYRLAAIALLGEPDRRLDDDGLDTAECSSCRRGPNTDCAHFIAR